MKVNPRFLVGIAALLPIIAAGTAGAAGDPMRGSTLYHTTYQCSLCHEDPGLGPYSDPFSSKGSTPAAILSAIQTVVAMKNLFLATLGNNPTDLADLAAYIAQSDGIASAGPDLNQHGFTGSWYEPATSGQGVEVEFFPSFVAPDTALVAGAWFTFAPAPAGGSDHERWYTFNGDAKSGTANVPITIYQNVGGSFNVPPTTSSTAVGTGTLSFATCTTGTLDYTFTDGSGRSGSIALSRITPNVTCVTSGQAPTNPDFALSGNWYNPATSGQGFLFEVNPLSPVLFATWYTYAPAGGATDASGQRWFTAQAAYVPGSRSVNLTLYQTTGGIFDAVSNPAPATAPVGTATVTFASCTAATLHFDFTTGSSAGQSGTIALQRVGPVPSGCTF